VLNRHYSDRVAQPLADDLLAQLRIDETRESRTLWHLQQFVLDRP